MPLSARLRDEHHPDAERSPRHDYYVVLSGGLEVGGFNCIGSGPSKGRWLWGAGIGSSGNATFSAGGYAALPDVCCTLIALAFRRMLARAELRERAHAKPKPPRRAPPEASIEPSEPSRHDDRDADRRLGPMIRDELSCAVWSGELHVGVLSRAARGDERWSWSLTGLHQPDDGDLVSSGEAEAFEAFERRWSQWLVWAGLEQVGELQRGVKPR